MGWSNAPGYRAAQLVPCSHALRRPQLFSGKITPPFHARFGPSRQTLITGNAPSRLFGLSILDGQTNAGTLVEQRLLFLPFIPPPSQLPHPPQALHPHRVALLSSSRRHAPVGRDRDAGEAHGAPAQRQKLAAGSEADGVRGRRRGGTASTRLPPGEDVQLGTCQPVAGISDGGQPWRRPLPAS